MTTIRIDPELLGKARDLGLNVSKISENALKEAVRRIKDMNSETSCQNGIYCGENRGSWCGGWDLNPRRPSPEDLKSSPLS
jgi:hypothetical protein